MSKIAFITGITGQTGSFLAELLLSKNYIVYGLIRRASNLNTFRIDHILDKLSLHYGDLTDLSSIHLILETIKQNHLDMTKLEVYNLGAMSHVKVSFEMPIFTCDTTAKGALNLLEAIRISGLVEKVKFYQAGSSEMFGLVQQIPQTETTKFYPRSPYAVAKLYAHWITINYREAYGLFACNGILFNHESSRRSHNFVTRKITLGVGKIIRAWENNQETPVLKLGNLESKRDWTDARDMVNGIWLMLQQPTPDDYVLCSEKAYSVRDFVEVCFKKRGVTLVWSGTGEKEVGCDQRTGKVCVAVDKRYYRPAEVEFLLGSCAKAREKLNWTPKISLETMIDDMLAQDCPFVEKIL